MKVLAICIVALLFNLLLINSTRAQQSNSENKVQLLELNKPIERELVGGGAHTYQINLIAGHYIHVVVEQRGVDVVVVLFDGAGKQLSEVDSPNGVQGHEPLTWIAESSSVYRLEVRSLDKTAKAGRYEIKVVALKDATEQDKKSVTAKRAFAEAERLRGQQTAESLRKAIEKYTEALQHWREIGDMDGQSNALNNMAIVHYMLGEIKDAAERLNQALLIARATNNRAGEGEILGNLGYMYGLLGQPQKALECHNQALPIFQVTRNRQGEGATLNNIGLIYDSLGEKRKALGFYNQALPIARELGDLAIVAVTISNIGKIHRDLGEPQKAIEHFNQSLQIQQTIKDLQGETITLNNLAVTLKEIGETQLALDNYARAFEISKTTGDRATQVAMLINFGAAYSDLGEQLKALDFYNQALPVLQQVGDKHGEALTRNNIGKVFSDLGKKREALDYYNQALPIVRGIGDRGLEASVLNNIGGIYSDLGDNQKAFDYYDKAIALFRAVGDRREEANTLSNIAESYYKTGEKEKARDYFSQSLQLRRDAGDKNREPITLLGIARVERDLGNLTEAQNRIEESLKIIESLRAKIGSQKLRASYFASYQKSYEFYTSLLMALHKLRPSEGFDAAALQSNERARARSLLELLNEVRADIRQGVDVSLLEREKILQELIATKLDRRVRLLTRKGSEQQVAEISKEIDALTTEYEQVETKIRTTSPNYAALTQPQTLKLSEIQQLLDANTILLEYALGDEISYLFAITQSSISAYELPKRAEIEDATKRVYELMTARECRAKGETKAQWDARVAKADADYPKAAVALSQMILSSVADKLGSKRLLIVADGALHYIPFAALPKPGGSRQSAVGGKKQSAIRNPQSAIPLVLNHEIVNLPSASTLALLRKETQVRKQIPKTIAIFANPVFSKDDYRIQRAATDKTTSTKESSNNIEITKRSINTLLEACDEDSGQTGIFIPVLGYSELEARTIKELVPNDMSKISLGANANYENATSDDLSNYRFIHFATHGMLNSKQPELSGILLSLYDEQGREKQNSLLNLGKIYNLKLRTEMVVLSACQTALGKEVKGEGLVGLTRGFMYAGTPRVVASLWRVEDAATSKLMKEFYNGILNERLSPAKALQRAQIMMLNQPKNKDAPSKKTAPYYWAAFTIQGEWK
jgi:CHAT domain-containing protein/tetratricopeptide (TPR) repeat protein